MTFDQTRKAAESDKASRWQLIEAIATDATRQELPIVSAASVSEAMSACKAAGNEFAASTVKELCAVAKFDAESTGKQRGVWRRYGWTIVREVANSGASQEAAYDFLTGTLKTRKQVEEKFSRPGATGGNRHSNDPELWDDDDWEAFDADVVKSTRVVLMARNLIQRGLYEPTVEATAQLALVAPFDLDAELAALQQ